MSRPDFHEWAVEWGVALDVFLILTIDMHLCDKTRMQVHFNVSDFMEAVLYPIVLNENIQAVFVLPLNILVIKCT